MKQLIHDHFEMIFQMTALIIFFMFGALMLAWYPQRDEMARWIEGGAVITAVAATLRRGSPVVPPPPDTKIISTTVMDTTEKERNVP